MAEPSNTARSSEAAVRRVAEELFVLGFPLLLMDAIRRAHALAISSFRRLPLTPHCVIPGHFTDDPDCLHTSAVADLATGPFVLHLPNPHGRYVSVTLIDSAGQAFATAGSRAADDLGSDVVIAGPGWRGEINDGARALRAPCDLVWVVSRIIARSAIDRPAVEALAAKQSLSPLQGALSVPPANTRPCSKTDLQNLELAPLREIAELEPALFVHRLPQLIDRAPPPVRRDLSALTRDGLELLRPIASDLDARGKESILAGLADGWNAIQAIPVQNGPEQASHWSRPGRAAASLATTYERAASTLHQLGAPLPEDVLSLCCRADESGRPLDGREQYRLLFSASELPPSLAGWRLTAHAAAEVGGIIGDHGSVVLEPDGSLEILLQREPPSVGHTVNWLRTPAEAFELTLRLYCPTAAALSGAWRMVPVERLGSRADGHPSVGGPASAAPPKYRSGRNSAA